MASSSDASTQSVPDLVKKFCVPLHATEKQDMAHIAKLIESGKNVMRAQAEEFIRATAVGLAREPTQRPGDRGSGASTPSLMGHASQGRTAACR